MRRSARLPTPSRDSSGPDFAMGPATDAVAVERTFCFIDLAGFTALTDAHGDAEAVALLDRFVHMTRAALGPDDELVKSIGDAVMLASPTPERAVCVVQELLTRCRDADGFPLPRAGAHHGRALARSNDYFGSSVNLAARVAGTAAGGQFLATRAVAEAAQRSRVDVTSLGPHLLRNIAEPTDLFEIGARAETASDSLDPVCRMSVDPARAAGWLAHSGQRFWFCSLNCASIFAANPDRHLPTS